LFSRFIPEYLVIKTILDMKKAKPLKSGDAKLQGLRRYSRYASQLPVEVD
jgi:hypothetical protein